ncbi:hypothetical protein [Sphingomonas sp. Leaf357]|uniref:hypothetical protein n=1 Tax=Sphingomonas sp. Leaf357 TaxID=1736350 RepID=UPI000ABF8020|nr:hypothetical protein [Sphingomonas sp. Leaf357]
MSDPEKLARLKAGIDMMLEPALLLRGRYDDDPGRPEAAQRLLAVALEIATTIVGVDALDDAMMRADDGDGMLLLANRLPLLRPLIDRNWPSDFSYDALIREAFAVAGGDEPNLFLKFRQSVKGRSPSAFAEAEWQIKALGWERLLKRRGVRTSDRQAMVGLAFKTAWGSIMKWQKACVTKFGQTEYDAIMADTENNGDLLADGARMSAEEVALAIRRDGAAYCGLAGWRE